MTQYIAINNEQDQTFKLEHPDDAGAIHILTPDIITKKNIFSYLEQVEADKIPQAGDVGFGVGVYPYDSSSLGLFPMPGCTDKKSVNYGNYANATNDVFVFIPKFWYRTGHPDSPTYNSYGENAVEIRFDFANTSEAISAGFKLHRAFIDGGLEKTGFFIGKYLASRSGTTVEVKRFGKPISLFNGATFTNSVGLPSCTGIYADALPLSKTFGDDFATTSAFMYGALLLLSLSHGQSSTSVVNCAWYDVSGTMNYPKGCNLNLKDVNDPNVIFTTCGDSGDAAKPLTGSGVPFDKTTHNGQSCGVVDLNGTLWEAGLGVTTTGASAVDAASTIDGQNLYVLKESVRLADLTNGFNSGNHAWGAAVHLGDLYDVVASPVSLAPATAISYWGNGTNTVFNSTSLDTVLPQQTGVSAAGTNLFGQDYMERWTQRNLFMLFGCNWNSGSYAGLAARYLYSYRSDYNYHIGFRPSAYGL